MIIPKEVVAREDGDQPPSPFSYFFPLLLIMIACGGYIYWRRSNSRIRAQDPLPLNFPTRAPTGIRLSEDGPPATSFTHNNDSTDSLPSHALQEIPELYQPTPVSYKDTNPVVLPRLSKSTTGTNSNAKSGHNSTGIPGMGTNRRSAKGKMKGPIEESDDGISEDDNEIGVKGKFGIGEEDEMSDSDSDSNLGPLGRK